MDVAECADDAVSRIAAAIGEPARARMLFCLVDGHLDSRALDVTSLGRREMRPNSVYPFHSTPIGWASYGQHENVVAYLAQFATIFDAVRCDAVARVAELLRRDPSLSNAKDDEGNPLASYVHPEMAHLEEMLAILVAHGVPLNTTRGMRMA